MAKDSGAGQRICISNASRVVEAPESKPSFWEGMFAVYFPLLTELLKYTKLW